MADLNSLEAAQTVKIAGANPSSGTESNFMDVDSSGRPTVKAQLYDAAGTAINLGQALMAASVPVVLASNQSAIPVSQSGAWTVTAAEDKNYGTVGATTLRVAAQVGNATGAADYGAGATGAQTLRVAANTYDGSGNAITSDNNGNANKQRLHVAVPDTTTAATALGSLNANVQISEAGLTGVGFQILAGTLIGTLVPEFSIDGGTTWFAAAFYNPVTSSVASSLVFSSANTSTYLTVITFGGTGLVRVRVSAYTSGTANAVMRASLGTTISITPAGAGGGGQAFGTAAVTYVTPANNTITLLLASNPSRKYALISNPSGSQLNMLIGNGGVGLTASSGIVIPSKNYYEFKGDNLWTGNIYGFMAGGAALTITEGTA